MNDQLPRGWAKTTLGAVISRPRSKVAPRDYPDLPFVGMDHIAPNRMELLGSVKFGSMKSNGGLFFDGDVLYGRMRPYLNKVHRAKFSGACSAEFIVFPKSKALNSDFLAYLLHHRKFVNFASGESSGDRPRVDFADVASYSLMLPPRTEQVRITSKIDELFSRIDEGARALERVQKLTERYRQSVLKAAVTGELTREWRERHKGQVESGDALLARILKARRTAWEKAELDKMKIKGIKPANDKWKQKYQEAPVPDTTDLPELPAGWAWASLHQLSWASGYGTSQKCAYGAPGAAVLRIPNIRTGRFDFEDVKNATADLEILNPDKVQRGDLLVVRTNGSESIIGIGAVSFEATPFPCYFASYLIRFRLVLPDEMAEWVNYCWQSNIVRKFVHERKATSAGQYNVSQSSLFELCLPIPPMREVREVIEKIVKAFSESSSALAIVGAQVNLSSALRQSILKQAFVGLLVAQVSADEPASKLLHSIVDKARAAASNRQRRAKREDVV